MMNEKEISTTDASLMFNNKRLKACACVAGNRKENEKEHIDHTETIHLYNEKNKQVLSPKVTLINDKNLYKDRCKDHCNGFCNDSCKSSRKEPFCKGSSYKESFCKKSSCKKPSCNKMFNAETSCSAKIGKDVFTKNKKISLKSFANESPLINAPYTATDSYKVADSYGQAISYYTPEDKNFIESDTDVSLKNGINDFSNTSKSSLHDLLSFDEDKKSDLCVEPWLNINTDQSNYYTNFYNHENDGNNISKGKSKNNSEKKDDNCTYMNDFQPLSYTIPSLNDIKISTSFNINNNDVNKAFNFEKLANTDFSPLKLKNEILENDNSINYNFSNFKPSEKQDFYWLTNATMKNYTYYTNENNKDEDKTFKFDLHANKDLDLNSDFNTKTNKNTSINTNTDFDFGSSSNSDFTDFNFNFFTDTEANTVISEKENDNYTYMNDFQPLSYKFDTKDINIGLNEINSYNGNSTDKIITFMPTYSSSINSDFGSGFDSGFNFDFNFNDSDELNSLNDLNKFYNENEDKGKNESSNTNTLGQVSIKNIDMNRLNHPPFIQKAMPLVEAITKQSKSDTKARTKTKAKAIDVDVYAETEAKAKANAETEVDLKSTLAAYVDKKDPYYLSPGLSINPFVSDEYFLAKNVTSAEERFISKINEKDSYKDSYKDFCEDSYKDFCKTSCKKDVYKNFIRDLKSLIDKHKELFN